MEREEIKLNLVGAGRALLEVQKCKMLAQQTNYASVVNIKYTKTYFVVFGDGLTGHTLTPPTTQVSMAAAHLTCLALLLKKELRTLFCKDVRLQV